MIFALAIPFIDLPVRTVRLHRWYRRKGDLVDYGYELFDLSIEENVGTRNWSRGFEYQVNVVSSDRGYLRNILAPPGSTLMIGDVVAVLTTSEDEPLEESDGDTWPLFRTVPNLADILPGE